MNSVQRGIRSMIRKPVKSILFLLVIVAISSFFMAGLTTKNANVMVQETTRQAIGASFRLESNEANRQKRLQEATKMIGEKEGSYGGYHQKQLANGSWFGYTDNSFETIKLEDVEAIAKTEGIKAYNLTTVPTPVNPVNFKRIEDADVDQSSDIGGVNLRGNCSMELDIDVAAGKINMIEGRMVTVRDRDVCVVSEELAELNDLKIGDILEFNDYHDAQNSKVYQAKIIGIYKVVQKITPYMHGDTYRAENIKEEVKKVNIDWERYDLLDNSGNSISMAANFEDLEKISQMLLLVVSLASFAILFLIFWFWIKNRTQEIGILMALGQRKISIWFQILFEAFVIGFFAFCISLAVSPGISKLTANYLVQQQQIQAEEQAAANEGKVETDYVAPDQKVIGVQIEVNSKIIVIDAIMLSVLLISTVSTAGISIMRKRPKEVLSEMS